MMRFFQTPALVMLLSLSVATHARAASSEALAELGSTSEEARLAARDAMIGEGVAAIPALLKVCDGEDRPAGKMARQALLRIVENAAGTPSAKDAEAALAKELAEQHTAATREEICRLIGNVGGDVAAAALAPLLDDEQARGMALYALIRIPGDKAQDVLIERVKAAPAGEWRSAMLDAIGQKHARRAAPMLLEMFKPLTSQPAPQSQEAAASAPASQPVETPQQREARRRERLALMRVMSQIPDFRCMRALRDELAAQDTEVAPLLLRCGEFMLSQGLAVEGEEAIAVVLMVTPPLSVAEQCEMCADISQIGSEEATNLALSELENANPRIRACVVNSSRMLKGTYATDEIAKQLAKAAPDLKMMLLDALGGRGDTMTTQAAEAMIATLSDTDDGVKLAALAAFPRGGVAEARPAIRKLLESNPKEPVRLAAESALFHLPATSTRPAGSRPATQASAAATSPAEP
jgi:HEAT repeat protein